MLLLTRLGQLLWALVFGTAYILPVCGQGGLMNKCFSGDLDTTDRVNTVVSFEEKEILCIIVGTYYALGIAFTLTRAWRCITFGPASILTPVQVD